MSYFAQDTCWTPPVLVISSDDWGGVNPPETVEDLDKLRDTLLSVTDAKGQPLVLTAYLNPAEPDFERISESEYTSYSYRYCYQNRPQVASRLRELHEAGLVDIEFHGREHYNIPLWLSLLKEDRPGYRKACRDGHIPWREGPGWDVEADPRLPFLRQSFLDASSYPAGALSVDKQHEMIASGLAMMEDELGVRPVVFTPPGYAYDTNTLSAMHLARIKFLDSSRAGIRFADDEGNLLKSGERWDYGVEIAGIHGIARNVPFEPYRGLGSLEKVLREAMVFARRAILSKKPVVISSHRWNYVAAVNPNRNRDLLLLKDIVNRISAEAPDIHFLGTADLVKHLYLNGQGVKRDMNLLAENLSPMERVIHGVRCTCLGHGRIRTASLIFVLAFAWLCVTRRLRVHRHDAL